MYVYECVNASIGSQYTVQFLCNMYSVCRKVLSNATFMHPLSPPSPTLCITPQLTRDKKSLEDKLQETQQALEGEENKSKTEHRSRLKLESGLQDTEEKLDRENKVCITPVVIT